MKKSTNGRYCMESYGNNDYELFVGKNDVRDDS